MRWGTFLTAIYVRCDLKSINGQRWWEQDRYDHRSHVLTQLMPRLNTSTRKGNHRPCLSTQGSSIHFFRVTGLHWRSHRSYINHSLGDNDTGGCVHCSSEIKALLNPKSWRPRSAVMLGGVAAELCQKEETSRGGFYGNSRPCYSMCSLSIPYSSCTCVYPNQSENILLFSFL